MTRLEGWSLNMDDWQQLSSVLNEVEWRFTRLNRRNRDSVPRSPGIYILATDADYTSQRYKMPKGVSGVIYVGRSESLRDRFSQHSSAAHKNPLLATCQKMFGDLRYIFSLVPESVVDAQQEWLRRAEATLVKVLSPPANRNVPQGDSIPGRLEPAQPVG